MTRVSNDVTEEEKVERAWVAGFFDGEGCISFSVTPRQTHLDLSISQACHTWTGEITEKDEHADAGYGSLKRVKDLTDKHDISSTIYPQKRSEENHRDIWTYKVTNREDIYQFLELVGPHLTTKWVQAHCVLTGMRGRIEELSLDDTQDYLELIGWRDRLRSAKGLDPQSKDLADHEHELGIYLDESRHPINNIEATSKL